MAANKRILDKERVRQMVRERAQASIPVTKSGTPHRNRSGMSTWALSAGVNRRHLYEFMIGKREPGKDLLDALDLEWRICYKEAQQ